MVGPEMLTKILQDIQSKYGKVPPKPEIENFDEYSKYMLAKINLASEKYHRIKEYDPRA